MLYKTDITPQILDSDLQGHMHFMAVLSWFERARMSLYCEFSSNLDFKEHGYVILKTDVSYLHEIWISRPVEVRTWVSMIGVKSFEVSQEAWQDGERCAAGSTIFCGFDFTRHGSEPLSDSTRAVLEKYLLEQA
ncbi:MAG: thioesterase family protein [Thermoguttaceae bacterium]|nr:thioesterase family protein [Thermoguttaceae bacterium]